MPLTSSRLRAVAALTLLMACDPDGGLKVTNTAPTASIDSHSDGAAVPEQTPFELSGTVGDANHGTADLVVTWRAGGDIICQGPPESDGSTVCETTLLPGTVDVKLTVADPAGATGEDIVTLDAVAGDAPLVGFTEPDGATRYYAGTPIDVGARATDPDDSATDLVLAWQSSLDGSLGLPTSPDSSGVASGAVVLSEGVHELVVTVTDPQSHTGSDSTSITVVGENSGPDCEIVSPESPSAAESDTTITFAATVGDDYQAPGELDVSWSSDKDGSLGSSTADSTGEVTFSASLLSIDTHTVTLTVRDELGEICTDSVLVAVSSRPEVSIDAPSDGDVVAQGADVVFSGTVTDAEDAAVDLSLAWTSDVDGLLWSAGADSSGLTTFQTDTLSLGTHIITLDVVDSVGLDARDTLTLTVDGLPSAPVVDIAPDPAVTADDLVVAITTDSVDPEGAGVSYAYAWYRDGVLDSSLTTNTVPASATGRGETWTVEVAGFDGIGLGPVGSDSVVVGNTAPVVSSLTLSPAVPLTDDILTAAVVSSDADGDSVSHTYSWTVDGVSTGTTTSSLDGSTWFDKGQTVAVTVTPADGTDTGAPVTASVVIGNSAPELSSVSLSPSTVYTNDTLVASLGSATDADGDPITYTYSWTVDGVSTGTTSDSLDGATYFERDDLVVLSVTPSDSSDSGTPATASITVSNSVPTTPVVAITPSSPIEGSDDLICEVVTPATDDDGDTLTYTFAWDVDGSDYPGLDTGSLYLGPFTTTYTDDSVPGDDTVEDEVWTCTAVADDGTDSSAEAIDSVTIDSASTCGNGVVDPGEEYEPSPGPFSSISVDSSTCRWDFSSVQQLYCNGTCTWDGASSCDQADADILCKLITDNPASTALSWTSTTALSTGGFTCANQSYGTAVNVSGRGLPSLGFSVHYQDSSVLANHGPGQVVAYPVCTDP